MKDLKEKIEWLLDSSYPLSDETYTREDVLEFGLKAYDMDKSDEWVSVEDALPESQDWMRVLINGKISILAAWFRMGKWYVYDESKSNPNITHWQPFTGLTPKTK